LKHLLTLSGSGMRGKSGVLRPHLSRN
jgi:hypothetical protein